MTKGTDDEMTTQGGAWWKGRKLVGGGDPVQPVREYCIERYEVTMSPDGRIFVEDKATEERGEFSSYREAKEFHEAHRGEYALVLLDKNGAALAGSGAWSIPMTRDVPSLWIRKRSMRLTQDGGGSSTASTFRVASPHSGWSRDSRGGRPVFGARHRHRAGKRHYR